MHFKPGAGRIGAAARVRGPGHQDHAAEKGGEPRGFEQEARDMRMQSPKTTIPHTGSAALMPGRDWSIPSPARPLFKATAVIS